MKEIKDLFNVLKEHEDFPIEGVTFVDVLDLFSDFENRNDLVYHIRGLLASEDFDVVVSPETRGALLGLLIAFVLNKQFVLLRKTGKLPGEVINKKYKLEYGEDELEVRASEDITDKRVLFVDDIYATGGTYQVSKLLIEELGGYLMGSLVLLDVLGNKPEDMKEIFGDIKDE